MSVGYYVTAGVGIFIDQDDIDKWLAEQPNDDVDPEYELELLMDHVKGIHWGWVGDAFAGNNYGYAFWVNRLTERLDLNYNGATVMYPGSGAITLEERNALNKISKAITGNERVIGPLVTAMVS